MICLCAFVSVLLLCNYLTFAEEIVASIASEEDVYVEIPVPYSNAIVVAKIRADEISDQEASDLNYVYGFLGGYGWMSLLPDTTVTHMHGIAGISIQTNIGLKIQPIFIRMGSTKK